MQSDIIKQIKATYLIRSKWLWGFEFTKKYAIIIIIENYLLLAFVNYKLFLLHCVRLHTPSLSFAENSLLKTIVSCFANSKFN